ncbi:hypothetical protein CKM354_001049800 [Cercospora kikuchii]|uniref:Uncharacterized protein n=1 Tax=Cercospora kikuchii TaxID=84275 RepID=A0A9P3CTP6_9PEZI|nr:uncharacterized protein CKM354_001049800 [Cercospora kikuchii]GIZ47407.1 hypothetical protein CKM354_001049800 [Cercospora kikuchii]
MQSQAAESEEGWSVYESKRTKKMHDRIRKEHPFDSIDKPIIRTDRDEFRPPLQLIHHHEDTQYIKSALRVLAPFNRATFSQYCNRMHISSLKCRPQRIGDIEVRYFALTRRGLMAKVPLCLQKSARNHGRPKEREELLVLDGDSVRPFADWLGDLPAPHGPPLLGRDGYHSMHMWHRERRKFTSTKLPCFADMPTEIKENILLHMVGEVCYLEFDYSWTGPDGPRLPDFDNPLYGYEFDRNILTLNKEIYQLVQPIIRRRTIKRLCYFYVITEGLNPAYAFVNNLTRLQLTFSDTEYTSFFHLILPGLRHLVDQDDHHTTAWLQLPQLKYLELWFDAPLDPEESNVWLMEWETLPSSDIDKYAEVHRFPCRKTMIDWILTAAFRYIQHIPTVNFTGYVKTVTRNKWLEIFRNKRERESQLAQVQEKLQELETLNRVQVPPPCSCPTSCYYDPAWGGVATRTDENYRFDFDDEGFEDMSLAVGHCRVDGTTQI